MRTPNRILHVVPFYSSDGSSGGPVRVAISQVDALRAVKCEVTLIGAVVARDQDSSRDPGTLLFPAVRLPGLGTAGIVSLPLMFWVVRNLGKFNRVHIHLSRDLVTLPVAALAVYRRNVILQTHGMIDGSSKVLANVIDFLATRRVLARARRLIALTPAEVRDLREVTNRLAPVEVLPNSIDLPPAASSPLQSPREVIFLARLHARKRPDLFVDAAITLLQRGTDVHFALVGPDEGAIAQPMLRVRDSGHVDKIRWEGPVHASRVLQRLTGAYLYVLPAEHEPFGLTVIEALAVGVPVVVSEDAALANEIVAADCGAVFDGTSEGLSRVIERYLDSPELRERQSQKATAYVASRYSRTGLGERLTEIYGLTHTSTEPN